MPHFYPNPAFGWTFYAVLLAFLLVATYGDLKRLLIPKKLTLPMLAVGVLFNVVRGAWMGSVLEGTDASEVVFAFARSPWLGALDGLLCSLAGFAVGFGVYLALWFLGLAGGGDVKLMGSLGAWVGPMWILWVMFGSLVVFSVLGMAVLIRRIMRRGVQLGVFAKRPLTGAGAARKPGVRKRDEVLALSLAVAIATGLVLPLLGWRDLGLLPLTNARAERAAATQQ